MISGCEAQRSAQVHEILLRDSLPPVLETFYRDIGRYPTQEEGLAALYIQPATVGANWKGPYLRDTIKMPPDPWMHEYIYRNPSKTKGKSYDLICLGQDGIESPDDFVFTK